MIARLHRFHGHGSLNFVYRKGKTYRGDYISLRVVSSRQEDYRLAVVVSKKVSKSAVVRNRIRRRIFEVVRSIKLDADANWQVDIVVSVFDDRAARVTHQELRTNIKKLLRDAGLSS